MTPDGTPGMTPELKTARLILRPPVLGDVPAYERHFVDYEVIRNLTALVPWPYPAGGIETYVREQIIAKQGNNKWDWGLFLREKPDELIGCVGLWRPGKPENRGFWLGRRFWGQGLMTEAVAPVMDLAFDELGFEELVFANAVGNLRSRRVKEKTGARLLRVEPMKFVDPAFTEHEVWELKKAEWRARRSTR